MNPPGSYRVRYTHTGGQQLRSLLVRSVAVALWDRVAGALREIERELGTRPREWGDPVRHYSAARITTYRRIYDELAVSYAVHDAAALVWVTRAAAVLGHPLRHG